MFNACFDHVKSCIDKIYKELTSDPTKVRPKPCTLNLETLNPLFFSR